MSFRTRGFTLIELIAVVAVVAILVIVGVPTLRDTLTRSRLSGEIQEFYGTLALARSEAIKRGLPVSICKSNNGTGCTAGSAWRDGWIVFVNNDNDSPAAVDGGETILRVFPALPTTDTLNANNNFTNYITYDRFGMANNVGTFVFCASSDETRARTIAIIRTRPRIIPDTRDIPKKEDGTAITSCENP